MKDNRIYKNRIWGEEFPEPGVPANDAWKQMNEMLIENNLTDAKKKDKRRLILWVFLFIVLTGSITCYFIADKKQNRNIIVNNSYKKYDSIISDKILLSGDSISSNALLNNDTMNNRISSDSLIENYIPNKKTIVAETIHTINQNKIAVDQQHDKLAVKIVEQKPNESSTKSKVSNSNTSNDSTSKNIAADSFATTHQQKTFDTSVANKNPGTSLKNKAKPAIAKHSKFHFGLEWNANFSLLNNKNYFDNYYNGKQYYMWLLPSVWTKINIATNQGLIVSFNPYQQQFAGSKTLHIEKPWIASVEPDIVTKLIKTRSINIGVSYSYQLNKKINVQAGVGYNFIQNALFNEQSVEEISGNILSEKIYSAKRKNDAFKLIKPTFINWNAGVEYNFKKISVGANFSQSLRNLSADSNYSVKPLNAGIYLKLHLK